MKMIELLCAFATLRENKITPASPITTGNNLSGFDN